MNKDKTYCHGSMRCNQCNTCIRYTLNNTGTELWVVEPQLDDNLNCKLYDQIVKKSMISILNKSDSDILQTEQQQQKKVEYHFIKQERRIRGLTLFSYNLVTKEIKPAEIVYCKDISFVTRLPVHHPKVTIEKNCVYRQALNKKNFIKVLKREGIVE